MTEATKAISNHTLGKCAARYKRLREAGREDRIAASMEDDAIASGISLEDFTAQLEVYTSAKPVGKRTLKKAKTETVRDRHLAVCSFLNEVVITGATDVAEFQNALKALATEADNWVLMTAVRKDKETGEFLYTINDSGWHDGSNRANQYSDRPQPAGKSKRHNIFQFPVRDASAAEETTEPAATE